MQKIKLGINGFGRIGKIVFRLLIEHPEIQLVGINDPMDNKTLLHLLKYDSVHGRLHEDLSCSNTHLIIGEKYIPISHFTNPEEIPWKEWGAELVLESSGRFKTRPLLEKHFKAGAKKIILSCPAEDDSIKTIIIGVNEYILNSEDNIISNASCTANCVAPLLHVLDQNFGIETVFLNTVHPYTNNQQIIDSPHSDLRRARTAGNNIIPTSSTAVKAVHKVMPHLKDRFHGIATRVPVPDGALTEFVLNFQKDVTPEMINHAVKNATENAMKGIIEYCADPIVSSDIINNPSSCIFDSLCTKVVGGKAAQVISWYDNEYGYSNRIVDLIGIVNKL